MRDLRLMRFLPATLLLLTGCADDPRQVYDILFLGPERVLATTINRTHMSSDLGESWTPGPKVAVADAYTRYSLEQVAPGADGSIWAVQVLRTRTLWLDNWASNVVRSDGGSGPFRVVRFESADPYSLIFVSLLATPDGDPLVLTPDGQLWSSAALDRLVRLGTPNPDGSNADAGMICAGHLYAAGVARTRAAHVWRSDDLGASWTMDFVLPDGTGPPAFACGPSHDAWIFWNRSDEVFRLDESTGSWARIGDFGHAFVGLGGIASDGECLYVAGTDVAELPLVMRMCADGRSEELPGLPGDFPHVIRIGPDGAPWVGSSGLYRWDATAQAWQQKWP